MEKESMYLTFKKKLQKSFQLKSRSQWDSLELTDYNYVKLRFIERGHAWGEVTSLELPVWNKGSKLVK